MGKQGKTGDSKTDSLEGLYFEPKEKRQAIYDGLAAKGQYFRVQYSNSSRAKCRGCHKLIKLGELRMKHVVCGTRCFNPAAKKPEGVQDVCGCWHATCFGEQQATHPEWFSWTHNKCEWKPSLSGDRLFGFDDLKPEDRERLARALKDTKALPKQQQQKEQQQEEEEAAGAEDKQYKGEGEKGKSTTAKKGTNTKTAASTPSPKKRKTGAKAKEETTGNDEEKAKKELEQQSPKKRKESGKATTKKEKAKEEEKQTASDDKEEEAKKKVTQQKKKKAKKGEQTKKKEQTEPTRKSARNKPAPPPL